MERLSTALVMSLSLLLHRAHGQAFAELDINDVRARVHANGLIGPNLAAGSSAFIVPAAGGAAPLYASGLWMGGLSSSGQLRLAAHLAGATGSDYFPGPLTTTNASITPAVSAAYDQVWSITRQQVEDHRAWFACIQDPECDISVLFPNGYVIPDAFLTWPAMGDVSAGQAVYLAPFIDHDADLGYNPYNGDHPCILGDQALYCIFNDNLGAHQASGGQPIGVEVQMMPFAYTGDPALAQTVFVHYKVINRSTQTLTGFRIGHYTDFELGCPDDDIVGTDAGRSMVYALNGDPDDQNCLGIPGYGAQPPAFGTVVLKGPLLDPDGLDNGLTLLEGYVNGTGFGDGIPENERFGLSNSMYFLRQGPTAMTDPSNAAHFHNQLRSVWKDNTPLTHGGTGYATDPGAVPTLFAFPGDSDPLGNGTNGVPQGAWAAALDGTGLQVDPRTVAGMGPFTLEPGMHVNLLVAYVFARAGSGGPLASVAALQQRVDSVRAFAHAIPSMFNHPTEAWPACQEAFTGIAGAGSSAPWATLHPNPATDQVTLSLHRPSEPVAITVVDARGRTVLTQRANHSAVIAIGHLPAGLYLVRCEGADRASGLRLVKE